MGIQMKQKELTKAFMRFQIKKILYNTGGGGGY